MTSHSVRQPPGFFVRRTLIALAISVLAGSAFAILGAESTETVAPTAEIASDAPSQSAEGAIIEVPADAIVIESDAPAPDLTLDQLMQKFRDALGQPPSYVVSERQLAGGLMEIHTRFGRFCVRPMPAQVQSGLGGDIALASPCASF